MINRILNFLEKNIFEKIGYGSTRTVFITKKYAYKLGYSFKSESYSPWRKLLNGLVCNLDEKDISKEKKYNNYYCPVIYSIFGGLIICMPRIERELSTQEYNSFMLDFDEHNKYDTSDLKPENVGILNGYIVVIDYTHLAF